LLTADLKAYKESFDAGVKEVRITRYELWESGRRAILLLKFVM
jgi:hypothetical protein